MTVEQHAVPEFVERLRAAGLSAKEIAARCGVCQQNARLWLRGEIRRPHSRNRRRIERLLREREAETNGGAL